MTNKISNFYPKSDYHFLSNFYESNFQFMGINYGSVEHFYQAAKAITPEAAMKIVDAPTPADTKKLGKKIKCRDDWEDVKVSVMRLGLRLKFTSNPDLMKKLLDTGDAILEEQNWWHDVYWGIDEKTGEGKNVLGKLLMELRESERRGA